jgi:serine/threonine protein kinase
MTFSRTQKERRKEKITMKKIPMKKITMKGGKKLGQGSFGCVINPPLKCMDKQLLRSNSIIYNDDYISKIIKTKYSGVAFSELNIGIKIYKFDKAHNFFVPFINACYFTPQKHNDIVYLSTDGKLISSNPKSFDTSEDTYTGFTLQTDISTNLIKEHKTKCILKNNIDYLNLLGPIAGDNLNNILNQNKNTNIKKHIFIKNNYWYLYSYLVKGLSILHKEKFVHKDIKPSNLVVDFRYLNQNWNKNEEKAKDISSIINCRIRYIDFGLTLHLNKKKYSIDEILLLLTDGTTYYTPIDIFAIKILYRLIKRGDDPYDDDFLDKMINKMAKKYQMSRNYYHHEGIRNGYIVSDEFINKSSKTKTKTKTRNDSKNYYLTPTKYEEIFKYILNLYKNNKLQDKIVDFLYGWDIYSLGIVFAKIMIKTDIRDRNFNNLIFKMIDLNPENRITINELTKTKEYINDVLHLQKSVNIDF